jgi:CheY-like chemotaxis protein
LTVTRQGPEVLISVSDTGIGIPAELLPRIFELFMQVHSKAEHAPGGLGIGLALVRRLTEMHGGTVTAHSEGLGRGTQVTVRIPALTAERVVRSEVRAPECLTVEPRRILVVDDNRDAAESLAMQLQLAGHEVQTAHDGAEALSVGGAFQPDIVLLDLGMPRMDGYETARQMRLLPWGKRTTLIALTGWGQGQDLQRTADAGFDMHLVKPVAESELFQALASGGRKSSIVSAWEDGVRKAPSRLRLHD